MNSWLQLQGATSYSSSGACFFYSQHKFTISGFCEQVLVISMCIRSLTFWSTLRVLNIFVLNLRWRYNIAFKRYLFYMQRMTNTFSKEGQPTAQSFRRHAPHPRNSFLAVWCSLFRSLKCSAHHVVYSAVHTVQLAVQCSAVASSEEVWNPGRNPRRNHHGSQGMLGLYCLYHSL